MKNLNLSISVKTSIICGVIVLVILSLNTAIFNKLSSNLVSFIFEEYVGKVEQTIDKQGGELKKSLNDRVTVISGICANASASFLYNINTKAMLMVMKSYMAFDGLQAIEVFDETDEPFVAVWKEQNELKNDRALPASIMRDKMLSQGDDSIYEKQKVGSVKVYYTDDQIVATMAAEKKKSVEAIAVFRNNVDSRLNKLTIIQIVTLIIVVAMLIAAIKICLWYTMAKPLYKLNKMVIDLVQGEGDLTKRLQVNTRDEVGELADWFNQFIERMQTLIKGFSENVGILNASSSSMSEIADLMASSAESVSEKSNTVAAATEEMSTNMTLVANASEQTTTNVTMVAAATEEMNVTFNEITTNSEKARTVTGNAVEKAKSASVKVNELGMAASEINKVTEVITEISEQTNLLALNATIEAARAGEAGKGFAVVANEIKELAKQTADATQDIKKKIEGIRASTEGTVSEIGEITQVIDAVNEIVSIISTAVNEQGIATSEISKNVAQASEGIQEVNQSVSESSSVAGEISADIADVNSSADEMVNSCSQVNGSAEQLADLAEQLSKQVEAFKV